MKLPLFSVLSARILPWILGVGALLLVVVSALPYAGSWNDGSRLAAVESLIERHTLAIDDSIFCRPTREAIDRGFPPYAPDQTDLLEHGTRDKLLIDGHFYSDKPAVISLLMAGVYGGLERLGLPRPSLRPDIFCWVLTLATSGLAYLVAVLSLFRLGQIVGLPAHLNLGWVVSFATATVALTYTRHVNNHILLLGVLAFTCLQFAQLARESEAGRTSWWRIGLLGTLAGLGFNLDFGSGPLLVVAMLSLVLYRCRSKLGALTFVVASLPWIAAGMAINHAIGGVWKPMNMVPEYSAWPGCPFNPENMTGYSRHGVVTLAVYGLALLFGKHGFVTHNLPLFLALPALGVLLRRRSSDRPELTILLGWCGATWLLYAVLSNNYGGACCSVRWFVPFLAPVYYLLAVYLQQQPRYWTDFTSLSAWGAVLASLMWLAGPWTQHMVPVLWPVVGLALASWLACAWRRQKAEQLVRSETLKSCAPHLAA